MYHWGTIPSKPSHAVSRIIEFNQTRSIATTPSSSFFFRRYRLNHADNVINQQTRMRQGFMSVTAAKSCRGNAHFIDEHTGAGMP